MQNILTRNGFEDFENIVDICYWNILWKYLEANYIFWKHLTNELLMWICPCAMMLVITPSLWHVITPNSWRHATLEAPTLHDTGKSIRVWVRLLPIMSTNHMQKGYCVTHHSLLPMGGRGKSLSVWVRPGRAKRPQAKEVLHGALFPATQGGGGGDRKILKSVVRLGRANKPHAKRGTYHASVFGF